jgi:alpha-glucosidase
MNESPWWRGAVIYQIYPRSFKDTNGDGIGDLPGIIDRLDYVARLGADAIWLSPILVSPMADFGYDIADFHDIDPVFGTLDDFDALLAKAHELGLKMLIDQVLSHSSSAHPWFRESRASRDNPRADWYVWADPRDDGTPPNNWLSIFGGSAWQWEPRRGQYYLHNFLTSQPDLNFHHPDVPAAMLDNLRFWLERGVDGFRLDSINFCFHDRELRSNPAKPPAERRGRGFSAATPYAYQCHEHDNTQPENLAFLARLRKLMDGYPGTVALGEVSSEHSLATIAAYTGRQGLHMSYSFALMHEAHTGAYIRQTVEALEAQQVDGWPCWAMSNHDCERVRSRWGGADAPDDIASIWTALDCALRGSVCIYQGEELGLPESDLPYDALRDPYGIIFWPVSKGRDGSRTPMPWNEAEQAGFTSGTPWLPVDARQRRLNVADQERRPDSLLNRLRRFLHWRRQHHVLRTGAIRFLDVPEPLVAIVRESDDVAMLAVFNPGPAEVKLQLTEGGRHLDPHDDHGLTAGCIESGVMHLPGYSVIFADMDAARADAIFADTLARHAHV